MTDGPHELPSGWRWVRVGEVASHLRSGFASRKKGAVNGDLLHLRPYNIAVDGALDLSQQFLVPSISVPGGEIFLKPGDVLFNNTNSVELVGKTALVNEGLRAAFSNHITLIRTDTEVCEGAWIALALRSLWQQGFFAQRCNKWIGQAGFNTNMLVEIPIPLPSLAEQHRIVAQVEALMERVREAKRLREQASRDTDPLMQSALAEALRELRSSYPSSTVGQLRGSGKLEIYGGGTPSKKDKALWEGSIPWVSPKDMKRWVIDSTEDHISPEAIAASSAKIIPAGAVLAVVRGMILARSWPIAVSGVDLTINQDMKALVPKAWILSEYLGYVLKGLERQVLGQVETAAHGTRRLRTSTMESLEVPTPSLSEQHRIVAYLDSVQKQTTALKRAQEDTDAELRRLEQAILDRAFRGEL
jgi:type I restriction enzyme, S subunit